MHLYYCLTEKYLLLYLGADLHGFVFHLGTLVLTQVELFRPNPLGLFAQGGDGLKVEVAAQMPEEGAADTHLGPVGLRLLPPRHGVQRGLVDHDLVVARLDETTRQMLQLLPRLHQKVVALGDFDGDLAPRVSGPDVQAGIPRATVDSEKVEICVEPGQDAIFLAILG